MKYFIGFVLGIVFVFGIAYVLSQQQGGAYYDCSMAEFHPDFPPQVREECRKLRQENWKDYSRKTT